MAGYFILGFFVGIVCLTIFSFFLSKKKIVIHNYSGDGYDLLHDVAYLVEPADSNVVGGNTELYTRGKIVQSTKDGAVVFVKDDVYNLMFKTNLNR